MRPQQILLTCALFTIPGFARPSDPTLDLPSTYHFFDRRDAAICKDVDNSLSDSWKCGSSKICVSLDNSTSALCCPAGSDCSLIGVVDCDAKKQDPARDPNTEVFTTKTDADLPQCGSACCPFGYTCSQRGDSSVCAIDKDKAKFVGDFPGAQGNTATSSTSTSSSATSTTKGTATATTSPAKSTTTAENEKPNPFPPGVWAAGFVPGIFVGALLVVGWMICTGRTRRSDASVTSTPRTEKRPMISEPINARGGRSDFNRVPNTVFSGKEGSKPDNWKMPTPPEPNGGAIRPVTPATPTPVPDRDRAQTMESIHIYSPPNFGQHPSATVSPLRTNQLASDRQLTSPFVSPLRADIPHYDNPVRSPAELPAKPARPASSVYPESRRTSFAISELDASEEKYTPAQPRYDADSSKRDTSFTQLMEHCGIPDSGNQFPVPRIPEQYQAKGKGRR